MYKAVSGWLVRGSSRLIKGDQGGRRGGQINIETAVAMPQARISPI